MSSHAVEGCQQCGATDACQHWFAAYRRTHWCDKCCGPVTWFHEHFKKWPRK